MSQPIQGLAPTSWHPNTADLRPLGLDPPGLNVGGLTYWEVKLAWFADGHLTTEQLAYIGALDPFLDGREREWRTDRGWRTAEDALRTVTRDDEEREAEMRGDLGEQTMELSV